MKPLYYRYVSSKRAGRPRLTHHHKGWWNETDEMSVEKWWNEISGRGKREKPREKPTQIPFRPPRNPHGVTETRSRDPSAAVGGERLTACATRPPIYHKLMDQLNWNFVCSLLSKSSLYSIKIIKFWKYGNFKIQSQCPLRSRKFAHAYNIAPGTGKYCTAHSFVAHCTKLLKLQLIKSS